MRTLLIVIISTFLFTGCSRSPGNGAAPVQTSAGNRNIHAQQTIPDNKPMLNSREVVAHLEQLAASIPQVQHAHCVIMGKIAVVGVDVKADLPRSRVDNIKYSVAEALKKDPYGVNAIVTADLDLNRRLQNIRQETMKGRPIAGFADEMGKIIGRIMPQLPRDVTSNANQTSRSTNPSPAPHQ